MRKVITALVLGVVLIFIGMTAATITGGVGIYVVKTLNSSVNGAITSDVNMFKSNILNLMGTVFMFTGIVLLVYAVAEIIASLWTSMKEVQGAGA